MNLTVRYSGPDLHPPREDYVASRSEVTFRTPQTKGVRRPSTTKVNQGFQGPQARFDMLEPSITHVSRCAGARHTRKSSTLRSRLTTAHNIYLAADAYMRGTPRIVVSECGVAAWIRLAYAKASS